MDGNETVEQVFKDPLKGNDSLWNGAFQCVTNLISE